MDKIFKEMSLSSKYYDGDFYAIAIDKYNKKNERRVEFFKKPKSEKSKIWVKDVLNCTRFKDYASAITHLEKTYDCEIEYVSGDKGDYDYMICHVILEKGLPVGFSYLNFKAKSSVKYTYPPTVTNLINNDPIPPEYIHDSDDNIVDTYIPLKPALQLHISKDEKDDFKTLINRCYEEKAKGRKPPVVVDSLPMPDLVKDNSSDNKKVHEYYVIKIDNNEYFKCFTDYGFDTTGFLGDAWTSNDFASAHSHMLHLNGNETLKSCDNDDPGVLYMIVKIKEFANGDISITDVMAYKNM